MYDTTAANAADFEWRNLYLQALFEIDDNLVATRIVDAERALIHRQDELSASMHGIAERRALINALNALNALRICLKRKRNRLPA